MIIRGNFSDFFGETMLPALNALTWNRFRQARMLMPKLYNVDSSTRDIEQHGEVTGVGLFRPINEAGEVTMDHPRQGFKSTFKHAKYGLGVEFSQDLVEDDKWGIIKQMPAELGMSCNETIEIQAATVFNNAFDGTNYPGPDGVALCSALHPLVKAGGYQSNTLEYAADLDVTSLELALADWETQRNSSGKHVSLPTPRLLAHPSNRANAIYLLRSQMRSDTANNSINAFQNWENGAAVSDILIWPKLTDPDAWFLVAPPESTSLIWYWRRKPYTKAAFDDKTETASTLMRYRASHGWKDFYGVYGSPGA